MSKPSLAETHPELAKQWHPTKNGDLTPLGVTYGSKRKVWWKCDEAEDHIWDASLNNRSKQKNDKAKSNGCPFCGGNKVALSNCLATTNPDLAKEWHPTKNGELTPKDITNGNDKKVWWICDKADDHEWEAVIHSRTYGIGCPCCSNQKTVLSNCLATLNSALAKEWHPTKNGNLTPFDFTPKSGKKVWWKCDKANDHEWLSTIANRSYHKGCPICEGKKVVSSNCLAILNPGLAEEWHPTKNGTLTPYNFTVQSHKQVWWKCNKADDHEWKASIGNRSRGSDCPYCSNKKVTLSNCLQTTHPNLAKEWHPTKNQKLNPNDVTYGSTKKVWWKCDKADDHEWEATINSRSYGGGCACCSGKKVVLSNCLQTINPDLAREWHTTKNGDLTPFDVTSNSHKKVWWKCDKADDHEWKASINNRSNGNGCSCCSGKTVVTSNCLATTNPELAKEWHPTKNAGLTPYDVTKQSHKKVWWQCDKGNDHRWLSTTANRNIGNKCPYCDLTPQSRQELIITFELKTIFKNIDPKGFKTILDRRLRAIDIFIPLLKLAIEFDGSFWHKDKKALDKIKSEMLMDEGYKVIRIREEPLKKIHENDIISPHPYNGKQITDNILKRILELYDLDSKVRNKIEVYLEKDSLQNEKGLDRYIDQILTEKAERSI